MNINNEIVKEASAYVTEYLHKHLPGTFYYHNLSHTTYVVNAVNHLCPAMGITEREQEILQVAAWFHDVGFTKQTAGHEKEGALMVSHFLKNRNIEEEKIAMVIDCILATQLPQQPANQIQQILCDADLLYLADADMIQRANMLRREWVAVLNKVYTDKEWYGLNFGFLSAHEFHTQYCRDQFNSGKMDNINQLALILQKLNNYTNAVQNNIAA